MNPVPDYPKRVLIVDDNPSDIELVSLALDELGCRALIHSACNGEEAIRSLTAAVANPAISLPDVLLLDVNMPKVGGIEVLSFISRQPALQKMIVVVLSTSDSPRDRAECLRLGATRYIVKAHRLVDFIDSMKPIAAMLATGDGSPPSASPPTLGGAISSEPTKNDDTATRRERSHDPRSGQLWTARRGWLAVHFYLREICRLYTM